MLVDPGDLGRRVAQRRRELGLTREELAALADVQPEYLAYLEERPAQVSADTLLGLAGALGTTPTALLGGELDRPPGHAKAAPRPRLETLDRAECLRLIAAGGVGRVVFTAAAGPVALPVNYTLADGAILFRTGPGSPAAAQVGERVGFEVDRIDEARREGWSVLAVGQASAVADPSELGRLHERPPVEPWAGGERELYLRIEPEQVSGRRIHANLP
jgi:transcriptional regulator with XRE-family HTH domain